MERAFVKSPQQLRSSSIFLRSTLVRTSAERPSRDSNNPIALHQLFIRCSLTALQLAGRTASGA